MKEEDLVFLEEILNNASWLFYGDLDEYFDDFIRRVFEHEFREYGFEEIPMKPEFAIAYWLLLSEFCELNLAEYGTSPRGAWLTEKGERFKALCLANENAISKTQEYIYQKH